MILFHTYIHTCIYDFSCAAASKKSLDSNLVEVLVPVLGIVIVVIVVVVGIVLCYIRKMKNKALAYSFQRVTFNEVQESDTI